MEARGLSIETFERLFKERYEQLFHHAYDFLGNEEAAKDIVSDVFSAVWDQRERMDVQRVVSYLHTSVRNRCLNFLRKERTTAFTTTLEQSIADNSDDWEAKEQRLKEMQAVIDTLSPRTRYVLEACYYHGHSYKEVAEVLGITTSGIKKHIVTAFAALRTHFNVKKS